MLVLLLPLYYILDQKIIQPEENYLNEKFGEEYTDYKDTTPRWISVKPAANNGAP